MTPTVRCGGPRCGPDAGPSVKRSDRRWAAPGPPGQPEGDRGRAVQGAERFIVADRARLKGGALQKMVVGTRSRQKNPRRAAPAVTGPRRRSPIGQETLERPRALSGQRSKAGSDVEGVRIGGRHPCEEIPSAREITRPFVEVGQRVPLPQVPFLHPADPPAGPGQDLYRTGQISLVSQGAGGDDPALSHQIGAG